MVKTGHSGATPSLRVAGKVFRQAAAAHAHDAVRQRDPTFSRRALRWFVTTAASRGGPPSSHGRPPRDARWWRPGGGGCSRRPRCASTLRAPSSTLLATAASLRVLTFRLDGTALLIPLGQRRRARATTPSGALLALLLRPTRSGPAPLRLHTPGSHLRRRCCRRGFRSSFCGRVRGRSCAIARHSRRGQQCGLQESHRRSPTG